MPVLQVRQTEILKVKGEINLLIERTRVVCGRLLLNLHGDSRLRLGPIHERLNSLYVLDLLVSSCRGSLWRGTIQGGNLIYSLLWNLSLIVLIHLVVMFTRWLVFVLLLLILAFLDDLLICRQNLPFSILFLYAKRKFVHFNFGVAYCARWRLLIVLRHLFALQFGDAHWIFSFQLSWVHHTVILLQSLFRDLLPSVFKSARLRIHHSTHSPVQNPSYPSYLTYCILLIHSCSRGRSFVDLFRRRDSFKLGRFHVRLLGSSRTDFIHCFADWHAVFICEDYWSFLRMRKLLLVLSWHDHRLGDTPKNVVILAIIKGRVANVGRRCWILQIADSRTCSHTTWSHHLFCCRRILLLFCARFFFSHVWDSFVFGSVLLGTFEIFTRFTLLKSPLVLVHLTHIFYLL